MNAPRDLPILSSDSAKDERSPGVVLLSFSDNEKTTAEDCGAWWYIREWEVETFSGRDCWFDRSGYSIQKDIVKQLNSLQKVTA